MFDFISGSSSDSTLQTQLGRLLVPEAYWPISPLACPLVNRFMIAAIKKNLARGDIAARAQRRDGSMIKGWHVSRGPVPAPRIALSPSACEAPYPAHHQP